MASTFGNALTSSVREYLKEESSVASYGTGSCWGNCKACFRNGFPVFFPWTPYYKTWWGLTVAASVFTVFFETYTIAFMSASAENDTRSGAFITEMAMLVIFVVDILINFNLAFFNENDEIQFQRRDIARHYTRWFFWIDLIGVFPFYVVGYAIADASGQANNEHMYQYLSLLRLTKLVRLHRVKQLFEILQYSKKISLLSLTLSRNFSFALVWTHFSACVFYFIARAYDFDADNTWLGGSIEGLSDVERYLTSLYWSIVTFTTVGYGTCCAAPMGVLPGPIYLPFHS